MKTKSIGLALMTALLLALSAVARATPVYHVLLGDGDPAAGVADGRFVQFTEAVLNNAGQVLFKGQLEWGGDIGTANNDGVWLWSTGMVESVAREGDPAPGMGGAVYDSFANLRLDDGGWITLVATVRGTGITFANNTCFVWGRPGAMQVVAREGDPVPGATLGERFDDLGSLEGLKLVTGRAGEIGFIAKWTGPTALAINAGAWMGPATNLTMIARDGFAAPDGGGFTFQNLQFCAPRVNSDGVVAFNATTTQFPADQGIWAGTTGGLRRVLAEGDALAAVPGATFSSFSAVTANGSNRYCFVASLKNVSATSDTVVVEGPLTNLQVVAREGFHAPGLPAGVAFTDLALVEPVCGRRGDVTFRATVSGPGIGTTNNTAIWAGRPGALYPLARRGAPARDLASGVVYSTSFAATFDLAGLNANGKVAYIAKVAGTGIGLTNDEGLWAGDPGFENLLLQRGQGVPLPGGGTGIVHMIDMVDVKGQLQVGGGQDGRARSMNDRDRYVVSVIFVAGTGDAALLRIEDVADPDENGLTRVLEEAHGVPPGGPARDAALVPGGGGAFRLEFRERPDPARLAFGLQESEALDGPWQASATAIGDAVDQSGLPAGVIRREAGPAAAGRARFFRVAVHPLPPLQ